MTIQFVGKRRMRKVEIGDFMGNNDFPFTAAGASFVYYKICTVKTYGSLDTRQRNWGKLNINCKLCLLEEMH
jgi:hypothetical protein